MSSYCNECVIGSFVLLMRALAMRLHIKLSIYAFILQITVTT